MGDMMLEFNVFTRLCAKDTKKNNHRIKYEYAIEYDAWRIEIYWPSLNKIRHYDRQAKNTTNYETNRFMQKIDFVYASLGIRGFDPDDIVHNSYDLEFEHYIHEARKEINKINPEYEPLVRTTGEGNVLYYSSETDDPEQGDIVFNSKEEYQLFDLMIFKSLENKKGDVNQLMKDKDIRRYLNNNPSIERRVMTYYDCYCQDPENAYDIFCKKDPAFILALEMYKSAEKTYTNLFFPWQKFQQASSARPF
jgi:ASC-1-like (ASCH) protein